MMKNGVVNCLLLCMVLGVVCCRVPRVPGVWSACGGV